MVNEEFNNFLKEANLGEVNYPLAELTILLGFFLVLFFEQLVIKLRSTASTPFLYLDEELNDEQQCKLLEENQLNDEILIVDKNQTDEHELDQRSELDSELSNQTFKNKEMKIKFNSLNDISHPNSFDLHRHPHSHDDDFHNHFNLNEFNNQVNLGFFMLIFASSIHSVFEGLALGLIKQYSKAINLFIGIFLHECIVAVALGINAAKVNKGLTFGLAFSFTIPAGIFLGVLIGYTPGVIGKFISAFMQGLATGKFLHKKNE